MGQTHSIEEESGEIHNITNNYVQVKKFTDTRFGEVKLLQEKTTGTKVLQKDYTSHSAKDYQEYVKECKQRQTFQHPNIVKIYGYSTKKEDAFCADFYKVSFYFEAFDHDLEQEIHKRAQIKDYFPEPELWYILDSLVSAGAYFQTNEAPVGDVIPYNVLITPSGEYKIVDQGIFGKRTLPNYFGLIQGLDSKNHYLSPEVFRSIKGSKKSTPVSYSLYKTDVFSLGMTLLEAALLEKAEKFYDWDKYTLNEAYLLEALDKVRTKYSEKLSQFLAQLLIIDETQRADFKVLDSKLLPFRIEIRSRFEKKVIVEQVVVTETITKKGAEKVKSHGAAPKKEEVTTTGQKDTLLEDLDRRIREAVTLTEDTLQRTPTSQYKQIQFASTLSQYLSNPNFHTTANFAGTEYSATPAYTGNASSTTNYATTNYQNYYAVPQVQIQETVQVKDKGGDVQIQETVTVNEGSKHKGETVKSSGAPAHKIEGQAQPEVKVETKVEEVIKADVKTDVGYSQPPAFDISTYLSNNYQTGYQQQGYQQQSYQPYQSYQGYGTTASTYDYLSQYNNNNSYTQYQNVPVTNTQYQTIGATTTVHDVPVTTTTYTQEVKKPEVIVDVEVNNRSNNVILEEQRTRNNQQQFEKKSAMSRTPVGNKKAGAPSSKKDETFTTAVDVKVESPLKPLEVTNLAQSYTMSSPKVEKIDKVETFTIAGGDHQTSTFNLNDYLNTGSYGVQGQTQVGYGQTQTQGYGQAQTQYSYNQAPASYSQTTYQADSHIGQPYGQQNVYQATTTDYNTYGYSQQYSAQPVQVGGQYSSQPVQVGGQYSSQPVQVGGQQGYYEYTIPGNSDVNQFLNQIGVNPGQNNVTVTKEYVSQSPPK